MKLYNEFKELFSVYMDDEPNPPDFYLIHNQDYKELVREIIQAGGEPYATDGNCYIDGVMVVPTNTIEKGCPVLAKNVVSRNKN